MARCCLERRLIGEILIDRRLITMDQLDRALEVQSREGTGAYIGEILMRLGYVSEIEIVTALVLQCNLPYIAISRHEIDPAIIRLIPADIAREERLVPLERIGNVLSIVMQNPLNDTARQRVEALTGCQVATFISTRSEIDQAIGRFYGETS